MSLLAVQPPAPGQVFEEELPDCRLNNSQTAVTCKVRVIGTAEGAVIVYSHRSRRSPAVAESLEAPDAIVRRTLGDVWVGRAVLVEQLWDDDGPFSVAVIVLNRAGNPAWNYLNPSSVARICGVPVETLASALAI